MIDFAQYVPQRVFLIQGREVVYEKLIESFEIQYPVVHGLLVPRFTVDHAKSVAQFALEGDGTERVIIVYFSVFSSDAAQVMLKALEEPDLQTTIVLITPYAYIVPLTIRSRLTLLSIHLETSSELSSFTKEELFEYIKRELSGDAEHDAAERRSRALSLLDQLEVQTKKHPEKTRSIYEAKHMLLHANLPTKFVMEYVATII